jgi:two-component system OmpR family sensor kinase
MTRVRLSLKVRLVSVAALATVVVVSSGGVLFYRNLEGEISSSTTTELRLRADDVAAVFAENRDENAGAIPLLSQVIDASGKVVSPVGQASLLQPGEFEAAVASERVINRPGAQIGAHARILARPVDMARGRVVIVVATSTEAVHAAGTRLVLLLLVTGPSLAVVVAVLAWVLTEAALRPVQRMSRRAETISLQEFGQQLPVPPGNDEIAELGATLNRMLARIETTVARERAFIDDASHELRTPLAVLRGELELAAQDPDDTEAVRAGLASAIEETDRIAGLAQDLLTLARADAGQVRTGTHRTDLLDVSRSAVARVRARDGVTVTVVGEAVCVDGEERLLEQIVTNLVANAERHARGVVDVSVSAVVGAARLTVSDDGPGLPPELLPRAFERFSKADTARGRGGTGLGLAIVAALTAALGGSVSVSNGAPLPGGCVTVEFPSV